MCMQQRKDVGQPLQVELIFMLTLDGLKDHPNTVKPANNETASDWIFSPAAGRLRLIQVIEVKLKLLGSAAAFR